METLKQKTARGLFWGGMNTMVQQVIGLLFGIILGRLLAPSDYGMMAIISVFSLVAVALQDSGFKVALANEKAPTHADYNAVFWFNILMGIALYAALLPPHQHAPAAGAAPSGASSTPSSSHGTARSLTWSRGGEISI